MIELAMVKRMARRTLFLAPVVVAAMWLWRDAEGAVSALIGVSLLITNLWLAGRVIGGLAENKPELLVAGAFVSLFIGLAIVVIAGVTLDRLEGVDFAVTGLVFALGHLAISTWEAADQFLRLPADTARTGS